jgi:diguanylate cyclase (GGDEF)-like protein/putative nucleotidyltransferase with HDIG domain
VAMIDVDDMKAMNDTYGHPIGDEALQSIGQVLQQNGATVGRYGGDEFVVILHGSDRAAAADYRREVLDQLAEMGMIDPATESHVPVAITMGFSLYPEEAETVPDLIRLADSAMYAQRSERAAERAGIARSGATVEDRAAAMIGEIVPLLTSVGDTRSKLQSVAHRLVLGLGYDGVTIVLFSAEPGGPALSSTVARVGGQLADAWDEDQAQDGETSRLRALIEQVQRPFIIDNLSEDERLSPKQRELLRRAELRSGLVVPMFRHGHTLGAIAAGSTQAGAFGPEEARLLTSVSGQVTAIVHMAALVEELQIASTSLGEARGEAVMLLAAAAEAHDPTTGRHLQSVRHLAEALARELGHPEQDAEAIGLAAVLHDIGKIRVPDNILTSPTELTIQQWDVMRRHTTWGADFLAGREGFALAATIARGHHERWDGAGYPDHLRGDDIPEAAAIVAVADCFDAITQDRPYQSAQPVEWAVREITASTGKQFSPRVVDALLRLHTRGELSPFAPDGQEQQAA